MINYDDIRKIHVELSSICNAACPVCPRNVSGGYNVPYLETNTFTVEDFKLIFPSDFIAKLDQILLVGRYGDPATCVDLPEILNYIYSCNSTVHTRMHTNGGIRNEEWWSSIAKYKNLLVIFSIDGLEDTNHIYRRNVNWQKLMSNVNAYISAGGNAVWEFLIFKHNQHQVTQAKEISQNLQFKNFILKRPYGFSALSTNITAINVVNKNGEFEYLLEPADDNYRNIPYNLFMSEVVGSNHSLSEYVKYRSNLKEMDVDPVYDAVEIDCHAVKEKEIYVDSLYNVHPCCWLAYSGQSKILPDQNEIKYNNWIRDEIGYTNINAKKFTLKQIVESAYFTKIKESWNKTHTDGRFSTCTEMCGKNKNLRKELVVND